MDIFRERSNTRSHILGTTIPSIQDFGASNFHIWHWNLGRQLEKLSLEGFWEVHEDGYDVSRQSVFFDYLSYLVGQICKTSCWVICSQTRYVLSTTTSSPDPSWLVNKATPLSWHMVEQGFNTWHKSTTMHKRSWGLSHWETHGNPSTLKLHTMISRRFSSQIVELFHLS